MASPFRSHCRETPYFAVLRRFKPAGVLVYPSGFTYKEVFPHLKDNEIWLGPGFTGGNAYFRIAEDAIRDFASGVYDSSTELVKFRNVGWFTNIDHGLRHQQLQLDTMAHNLKFNKKLKKKFEKDYGKLEYPHYDNYDAIEVPFVEAIPSDYDGVMGVPITFMDKYSPDQFEILGCSYNYGRPSCFPIGCCMAPSVNDQDVYKRLFVRNKRSEL